MDQSMARTGRHRRRTSWASAAPHSGSTPRATPCLKQHGRAAGVDSACSSASPATRGQFSARVAGRPRTSRWLATLTREYLSWCSTHRPAKAPGGPTAAPASRPSCSAALIAVADRGRALAGLGTLDAATQTLPLLYSVSSADFRDITAGSNGHRATPGYDLATGLGSPRGALFVSDLSNPNVHATIQTASSGTKARA